MTPTTGQPTEPANTTREPTPQPTTGQPEPAAHPTPSAQSISAGASSQLRASSSANGGRPAQEHTSSVVAARTPAAARRRVWPWAVGSALVTLAVLLATFAGHYALAHKRQAAEVVAAQALSPLAVAAIAHPQAGAALFAVDPNAHHLVALTYPTEVVCPPIGSCPAEPARNDFVTLDDATGARIVAWPLVGAAAHAAHATLLLLDDRRNIAYAISPSVSGQPGYVDTFSTLTGAY